MTRLALVVMALAVGCSAAPTPAAPVRTCDDARAAVAGWPDDCGWLYRNCPANVACEPTAGCSRPDVYCGYIACEQGYLATHTTGCNDANVPDAGLDAQPVDGRASLDTATD